MGTVSYGDEASELRAGESQEVTIACRSQVFAFGLRRNGSKKALSTGTRWIVGELTLEASDQTGDRFRIRRQTNANVHLRPNDNKMSDGERGRAALGLGVWKSSQK